MLDRAVRMGPLVARALRGSWRATPPPHDLTADEVRALRPRVGLTGEIGLLAHRLAGTPEWDALDATDVLHEMRLSRAVFEHQLPRLIRVLNDAGVDPILVKGWSVARRYGARALRPCGDVDLCVRAEEHEAAARVCLNWDGLQIDLHEGFGNVQGEQLLEDSYDAIFARSHLVPLGDAEVRVLCDEDQLRLVSIHMLRHGAYRPLWLCDVAALLETLPGGFDWDLCLGTHHRRSDWVRFAVLLARDLLGAETSLAGDAPAWLVRDVLHLWGDYAETHATDWRGMLVRPPAVYDSQRFSWSGRLNPLRAADQWHGPLARLPRLAGQGWLFYDTMRHIGLFAALAAYRQTPYPRQVRRLLQSMLSGG